MIVPFSSEGYVMRTPCPVFMISKLSRSAGYRTFRFGNRFDDTFSTLGTFEDKEILDMMLFEFTISIGLCRCPVLQFGSGDGDGGVAIARLATETNT